jgi:hypothetical protein
MFLTILNNFIDKLFYLCVDILNWSAKLIGISYELINIIIFVIVYPVFVVVLLLIIKSQRKKIWHLESGKLQSLRIK